MLLPIVAFSQNKGASPISNSQQPATANSTYAVVIGISDYQDPGIPDLRFADKDAEAFANYLRSNAGGKLDVDHLKVLINKEATMAQFANALDWLWEVCKEGDQAIIYFSGHGDVEKKSLTQPGFLLCWDAPARVYMAGGAFALPMLQEVISTLSIQNKSKVIVITDACRSGTLAGSSVGGSQATAANLSKQFGNEIKIMSCQPNEYSIEGEQWGGGRGAFSFHLLDALYGLADKNNDQFVTLQEIGRYLEDHVTNEVAPVSQIPMTVGNRNERLTSVDAKMLASIKSGKTNQTMMLSAVESRGIEEDVLSKLDTSTIITYQLFKADLKNKIFLRPEGACANSYYEQLIQNPKLERLHTTMKRNYAAALQDDAQQAINIWFKADVQQLDCLSKRSKYNPIPEQLGKAAELLGAGHYIYNSLMGRKQLFEGITLVSKTPELNSQIPHQQLELFRKAKELEPLSALPWYQMSLVYINQLNLADSANWCVQESKKLAPNWILPFADLAAGLIRNRNYDMAKNVLQEAELIDSTYPYVITQWANWFLAQPNRSDKEKALKLFEKYRKQGGYLYSCWHHNYSQVLVEFGKIPEALEEAKNALAFDTSNQVLLGQVGVIYNRMARFKEAEEILLRALSKDTSNPTIMDYLAFAYMKTNRFEEAERLLWRVVEKQPQNVSAWNNIGNTYTNSGRLEEAEKVYLSIIEKRPDFVYTYINLSTLKVKMNDLPNALYWLDKTLAMGFSDYQSLQIHKSFTKLREMPEWNDLMKKYFADKMYYSLACEQSLKGELDKAFEFLELSLTNGWKNYDWMQQDSDLAPLRATAEWKTLMKKYFP